MLDSTFAASWETFAANRSCKRPATISMLEVAGVFRPDRLEMLNERFAELARKPGD